MNRLAGCIFGIALSAALLAGAVYFFGVSRLDTILSDSIRREYMLPPSSEVEITRGSILDTLQGEVKRFAVSSAEAKIDGLVVEDLRFLAEGIRFDLLKTMLTGQAELTEVANGELQLKVGQQALKDRWREELESKGLSNVNVQLDESGVKVSAVLDLKLTKIRVGAKGKLVVDGTDQIKFKAGELELGGAQIGIEQFKSAFSGLTPVIDLGRFKMSIAVDELKPEQGYLRIRAHSISLEEKLALDKRRKADEKKQKAVEEAAPPAAEPAGAATENGKSKDKEAAGGTPTEDAKTGDT